MENGVEAIKIIFGMLIFVLAISISISAFTQVLQAMHRIWEMQQADESYVTVTDANGNEHYLNYVDFDIGNGTREVSVETIVLNMYRAYKENFTICFFERNGNDFELYTNGENQINYVDLIKESYSGPSDAIEQLRVRLDNGLYEKLADNTFVEYLGEYYQDDLEGETEIAEVNKTKKRVIVYMQK